MISFQYLARMALLATLVNGRFFGVVVAYLQGGIASVYTGVAILPLVPGFTLYQAMLAFTQGTGEAAGKLTDAVVVSLAIAGGVAVGLALGRNLQAVGGWMASRQRSRPA